jgi:hypothetical protein
MHRSARLFCSVDSIAGGLSPDGAWHRAAFGVEP